MRDPREHRERREQRPKYIGRRMGTIEEAEKKRGAEKREAFTRGKRTCHKLRACKSEAVSRARFSDGNRLSFSESCIQMRETS